MKKLSLILILLITHETVLSQPCLPEGITFSTQAQIDSFQINYPGCIDIEGFVEISGNDITNLYGLSVLNSVGEGLYILFNANLTSLAGLDNLCSVGGNMMLMDNTVLASLEGLENLTSIGGYIDIYNNDALTSIIGLANVSAVGGSIYIEDNLTIASLDGLGNFTSIPGNLNIIGNASLTSMAGLEDLTSIGGDLQIIGNDSLTSLAGLDNVNSIGEDLYIWVNLSLTTLSGLENVDSIENDLWIKGNNTLSSLSVFDHMISIGGDLWIEENQSLSTCHVQGICNYMDSPNGSINIFSNASGCMDPPEVYNACDIDLQCLPYGNYYFLSQSDIDNFQVNYPGCTELEGLVEIRGNDITNLAGINIITSIGGDLEINSNDILTSLAELENLFAIGDYLRITYNDALTNLSGLDNIDAGTISNLRIYENPLLYDCAVQSICDYLSSPNGMINIEYNSPGCNSQEEVEEACGTIVVEDFYVNANYSVSPNPFTSITTLLYTLSKPSTITLRIFNSQGQQVDEIIQDQPKGPQQVQWNAEGLPAGIYYYRIQAGEKVGGGKMVLMR